MKCTCGHVMSVDADSKEDAISQMKELMTEDALNDHFKKYHKEDEQKPTLDQSHMMIEQQVVEGILEGPPAM